MEIEGKIVQITEVNQKTEKYRFRELVLEFADGQYNQYAVIKFSQNRCDLLGAFKVGHLVRVNFAIRGRQWQDRYFCNLEGWRVELIPNLQGDPATMPMNQTEDPFAGYATTGVDRRKDPDFQKQMDDQLPW